MPNQISTRELDLIIKELERLANCYDKLVDKTMDKSLIKWLVGGSFGFTVLVLALVLKIHFGG